ncbi:MAG: hypothetical protein OXL68_06475 [Paracoccaceae bacterium]|nr:hypothetical protein [Paracoccaceae bacterium]
MMSVGGFAHRFTQIDDLTRPDHWYLAEDDLCYFMGEYTARQGYAYSDTNNLILNFKKPVDRRGRPEWRHKENAIRQAAEAFRRSLNPKALESWTFVPMPPSKMRRDPLHDDRLTRMLHSIRPRPPLDIRELIVQTESTDAVHNLEQRPRPDEIAALYNINESLSVPGPVIIVVVDDLLTTGAHFRAAHTILSARFPTAKVMGLFIARRVPNTANLGEIDL